MEISDERIPLELTREQADDVIMAIGVALDEMPWTLLDERLRVIVGLLNDAIAAKLRAQDAGEGE